MKTTFKFVAILSLTALFWSNLTIAQQPKFSKKDAASIAETEISHPYRLFETSNIWTFILLNTVNGKAWQVNYSLDDSPAVKLTVNGESLLPAEATPKDGRFTLHPTNNMYNFILLDREDGRVWQLQWSHDSEKRGLVRSIPFR